MDLTSCNQRMARARVEDDVDRIVSGWKTHPPATPNEYPTIAKHLLVNLILRARDEEMKDLQSHAAGILRHCLEMGTDDEIRGLLFSDEEE